MKLIKKNNWKIKSNDLKGLFGFISADSKNYKIRFVSGLEIRDDEVHNKQSYRIRLSIEGVDSQFLSVQYLNYVLANFRLKHESFLKIYRGDENRKQLRFKLLKKIINNINVEEVKKWKK